jgi:hypothetical protein
MSRTLLITILSLSLGTGLKAATPETNAGPGLDWNSFQAIAQKNIFDPTRAGGRSRTSVKRAVLVRTFTFRGTIDDTALFTGEGAPKKGYMRPGKLINGFKLMKVTLDFAILTDPSGTIVRLNTGDTMRQEEDGPWTKSDQAAPPPITVSGTKTDGSAAPSSAAPTGTGLSDVLERLRQRHKQE